MPYDPSSKSSRSGFLRRRTSLAALLALLLPASLAHAQTPSPNDPPSVNDAEPPSSEDKEAPPPPEDPPSTSDADESAEAPSTDPKEEAPSQTAARKDEDTKARAPERTQAPPAEGTAPAPGSSIEEGDLSEGLEDLSLVDLLQLDLRIATTKTNTTVQASPAAVTVISKEDIERFGYRSVAEALRDVVGTHLVDDHVTPNLGVRGVPGTAFEGSGAVKVMIDGVPVAFRTTGENWLGPALVPMASVERIEIIKGPTSSLYGADAFLGVINVITKDVGLKNWGEVSASQMTSYNGKPGVHVEGAAGMVMRPWRLTLGAQFDQEDRSGLYMPESSPAPSFADTATDVSRGQRLRSGVAIFKLSNTPNRKTSYSLAGRYAVQHTGAEFAPWLQFTDVPGEVKGTRTSLQQGTLTLKAGSSITRAFRLEATGTGFFGSTLPNDSIDTGDTLAVVHRDLSYFGGEGTLEAILTPIDPLRFVLGVEASADREHLGAPEYKSRVDGAPLPSAGSSEDFDTTLVNLAGRAQMTWDIIPDYLVPTGGIRFDHNSVYGDKVSGRVAVVSRVLPDLYLKSSYGTAFKVATPLLLYGQPLSIGDVIGRPELGAQELRSWDITADYARKAMFDLEVSFSYWDLIDRAVFRPEQINLVASNAADATGWTVEAEAKTGFSRHVGGSLGFEWVEVVQQSGDVGYRGDLFGTEPAIYPGFITRGRVWVQPRPMPLEFWTAAIVVGPRNASDSNTLEAGERYVLPTYVTLDAGVRTVNIHWFGQRLTEFSVRAQNLINTQGAEAGFFGIDYPAAPPKVQFEVRQEL